MVQQLTDACQCGIESEASRFSVWRSRTSMPCSNGSVPPLTHLVVVSYSHQRNGDCMVNCLVPNHRDMLQVPWELLLGICRQVSTMHPVGAELLHAFMEGLRP